MTEAEWQEQLKVAQATVNALMAQRNDEANRVANLMAQLDAAQRTIQTRDGSLAEKDAQIKALMETAQPAEKPNGIAAPIPEVQALAPPAMAPAPA